MQAGSQRTSDSTFIAARATRGIAQDYVTRRAARAQTCARTPRRFSAELAKMAAEAGGDRTSGFTRIYTHLMEIEKNVQAS